ncbi:MAG: hypothetical protein M1816_002179, partial [Peltula sp. TS41687]
HPDTLTSVSNLAGVLQHQGKYEAAEEMNRRALEGYEKALGKEHPHTLTSVSNLAGVLQDQGKYEAAEEMNRRALEGREKALGKEHPHTLNSVSNLARVLQDQGKQQFLVRLSTVRKRRQQQRSPGERSPKWRPQVFPRERARRKFTTLSVETAHQYLGYGRIIQPMREQNLLRREWRYHRSDCPRYHGYGQPLLFSRRSLRRQRPLPRCWLGQSLVSTRLHRLLLEGALSEVLQQQLHQRALYTYIQSVPNIPRSAEMGACCTYTTRTTLDSEFLTSTKHRTGPAM